MTRTFLILGALFTFVATFVAGTLAGTAPANVLRDSVFAAMIGALLGKGFALMVRAAVRQSLYDQHKKASAQEPDDPT